MKGKKGCKAQSISIGDQVKYQLSHEIFFIIEENIAYGNIPDEPEEIAEAEEDEYNCECVLLVSEVISNST